MFRPVPDVFLGSSADDGLPDESLSEVLATCFSAVAVLSALAVWIGAYVLYGHPDPFAVLKISCCAVLGPALLGVWTTHRVTSERQRVVTRIYARAMDWLAQPRRLAISGAAERGLGGVAGLIGLLTLRSQRLGQSEQTAEAMRRAVVSGRSQAIRLAVELREDAATLSEAAAEVETSQAFLGREMTTNAGSLALGDMALGRAADGIDQMAERVQATTACAQQMASLAVRLSEVAHTTHRAVAGQDDRSSHLVVALDQIEQATQAAARLLMAADPSDDADLAADNRAARAASEMQLAVGRCQPALAAAHAVMRDLVAETAAANRRTLELGEMIARLHELGLAVSHAVHQQSADIGAVLTDLYEARSGFAVLRASVAAVTRVGAVRADAAGKVHDTALRLPTKAERMAAILRDIPDFRPLDKL